MRDQGRLGKHLEAFFALMYYALRPEKAVNLTLGQLARLLEEGWGEVLLTGATPYLMPNGPTTVSHASTVHSSTAPKATRDACLCIPNW